jgi:hypothetical protein
VRVFPWTSEHHTYTNWEDPRKKPKPKNGHSRSVRGSSSFRPQSGFRSSRHLGSWRVVGKREKCSQRILIINLGHSGQKRLRTPFRNRYPQRPDTLTPGMSRCRKRERGTSGRWRRQSATYLGWAASLVIKHVLVRNQQSHRVFAR